MVVGFMVVGIVVVCGCVVSTLTVDVVVILSVVVVVVVVVSVLIREERKSISKSQQESSFSILMHICFKSMVGNLLNKVTLFLRIKQSLAADSNIFIRERGQ